MSFLGGFTFLLVIAGCNFSHIHLVHPFKEVLAAAQKKLSDEKSGALEYILCFACI